MAKPRDIDWEAVLGAAADLQKLIPGTILVGGTAAALHVAHRFSTDADHVLPDLRQRFDELLAFLEGRDDWVTNRVLPPKLILGDFEGVETGLRQLIRSKPLETTRIQTAGGVVTVPTCAEMIRIKGWLIIRRNATRDFIDFAALTAAVGPAETLSSLVRFDDYYQDVYRPERNRDVSPALQLSRQLAEPRPADLERTEVSTYKGIVEPWGDWSAIAAQCRVVSVLIVESLTQD